jgi:hypothetical protein
MLRGPSGNHVSGQGDSGDSHRATHLPEDANGAVHAVQLGANGGVT